MLPPAKNKFMEILEESPELIFDIFRELIQYFSEDDLRDFHGHLIQYEILSTLEQEEYIDETIDEE